MVCILQKLTRDMERRHLSSTISDVGLETYCIGNLHSAAVHRPVLLWSYLTQRFIIVDLHRVILLTHCSKYFPINKCYHLRLIDRNIKLKNMDPMPGFIYIWSQSTYLAATLHNPWMFVIGHIHSATYMNNSYQRKHV